MGRVGYRSGRHEVKWGGAGGGGLGLRRGLGGDGGMRGALALLLRGRVGGWTREGVDGVGTAADAPREEAEERSAAGASLRRQRGATSQRSQSKSKVGS